MTVKTIKELLFAHLWLPDCWWDLTSAKLILCNMFLSGNAWLSRSVTELYDIEDDCLLNKTTSLGEPAVQSLCIQFPAGVQPLKIMCIWSDGHDANQLLSVAWTSECLIEISWCGVWFLKTGHGVTSNSLDKLCTWGNARLLLHE